MTKTRILIIDSDNQLVQTLREQFLSFGYEVGSLAQLNDTRFLKEVNGPHLVILDVLNGSVGREALQMIRKESHVPVILTSANCTPETRTLNLEAGADDCIPKPFEPRELVARANSVLRRASIREPLGIDQAIREWKFKGLTVQSNRRRIVLDNEPIELTTAEFDLLKLLVSNTQQPMSREMILDRMRGIEWEAVDRSVDILVSRLRDKLKDDPRRPRFIRTVRSVGYQFVGEPEA